MRYVQSYTAELDETLKISLSLGFENTDLRRTFINLRHFINGKPSKNGITFRTGELDFLIEEMKNAIRLQDHKAKKLIGDRTLVVKNIMVPDLNYNPSDHEDQIDGLAYKKSISVGFRKNAFSMHRTFDVNIAEKLVHHLTLILYITNNLGNNLPEYIFDWIMVSVALQHMEPNQDNWKKLISLQRDDLKERCEDLFDFFDDILKPKVRLLCQTFAVPNETFNKRFNSVTLEYSLINFIQGSTQAAVTILDILNNLL